MCKLRIKVLQFDYNYDILKTIRYGAAMASTGMMKPGKRAADESAALTRLKL